jgi:predicted metal-binding membrane protein
MAFLWAIIGVAWLLAIVAQMTGEAPLLHHHALIEHGPPLWLAVLLFVPAWQVMVAAMMLPASVPSIGRFNASLSQLRRPTWAFVAFVGSYALLWGAFGLLAFAGDFVLHHIVDVTPWLAQRPWLIEGGVIGLAGTYQLVPLKRRSLAACRHHDALAASPCPSWRGWVELGVRHAVACLGSSWALMLLMFAEGFANLWWMVGLTALMTYEAAGRQGQRAARAVGFGFVSLAVFVLVARASGITAPLP